MAPDLAAFLPGFVPYHVPDDLESLPIVVVTAGLLWWAVRYPLEAPLRALAPAWVAERIPKRQPVSDYWVLSGMLVLAALILGSLSHIVWDAFTHRDAWGLSLIPELNSMVRGRPAYSWLQDLSSIGGMAVLTAWFLWQPRSHNTPPARAALGALRALMWVGIVLAAGVGLAWGLATDGTTSRMISVGIRAGSGLAAGVVLTAALVWWLLPPSSRNDARPPSGDRASSEPR